MALERISQRAQLCFRETVVSHLNLICRQAHTDYTHALPLLARHICEDHNERSPAKAKWNSHLFQVFKLLPSGITHLQTFVGSILQRFSSK